MLQAQSLRAALAAGSQPPVFALARYIEEHIAGTWETLLEEQGEKLADAYARAGDMAYGTYLNLLFRPVHRQLKQAGLSPSPPLPGDFNSSREWGNADESDQQRWMWSTIERAGEPLGAIVTIVFHDHTQFRVPRRPQIIGLAETGQDAVEEALSRRSAEFRTAPDFKTWYEAYLREQAGEG